MISRHSRRNVRPVEPLNQFPITAAKGVDGTKNADSLDTVQELQNFDITPSGDAELRKPAVRIGSFSCADGEVLKVLPLYRTGYFLKVTRVDGAIRAEIVDESDTPQGYKLIWYDYYTEEEYSAGFQGDDYTPMTFASWDTAKSVDTNTTTLILNTKVRLDAAVFGTPETIYDPNLYANIADKSFPRTIQLYWSDVDVCWIVKVVTPTVNILNTAESGELGLDANMALDNPYAIRDSYNSSAPTVKNIIPYVSSYKDPSGKVVVDASTLESAPVTVSGRVLTPSVSVPIILPKPGTWTLAPASGTSTDKYNTTYTVDISVDAAGTIYKRALKEIVSPSILVNNFPIYVAGSTGVGTYSVACYLANISGVYVTGVTYSGNTLRSVQMRGTLTRTFIREIKGLPHAPWDTLAYNTPTYPSPSSTSAQLYPPSVYMCLYFIQKILNNTAKAGGSGIWSSGSLSGTYYAEYSLPSRIYRGFPAAASDPVYDSLKGAPYFGNNGPALYTVGGDTMFFCGFPLSSNIISRKTLVHGAYEETVDAEGACLTIRFNATETTERTFQKASWIVYEHPTYASISGTSNLQRHF